MATKTQIKNMVDLINEKYQFSSGLKLVWERGINGYSLALAEKEGCGGWIVVFTQHQQVSANTALLILQMLFHDILERQNLNHYKVTKRV